MILRKLTFLAVFCAIFGLTGAASADSGFYIGAGYGKNVVEGLETTKDDVETWKLRSYPDYLHISACGPDSPVRISGCFRRASDGDERTRGNSRTIPRIFIGYSDAIGALFIGAELEYKTGSFVGSKGHKRNRTSFGGRTQDIFSVNSGSYNMSALFGWNMNNRSTIFSSIGAARGSFDIHHVIGGASPVPSTNVKLDGIRFGIGYQTKIKKGLSLRLEWGQTDYEETKYTDDISRFADACNKGIKAQLGSALISANERDCGASGTAKGISLIKSIDDLLDITENHFSVNLVYQFGSGVSKDNGELLATGTYVLGSIGYQAGSYIYDADIIHGTAISSLIADNEELEIQGSAFSVGVGYNRIFARDLYLGTFLSYRQTDTNSKYYRGLNTDLEMQEEITLEGQVGRVLSDSTRAYLALGISRAGFRTTTSIPNGKQPNGGVGEGNGGVTLEPLESPADRQDLGPMIAIGVDTALTDKLFLNARLSYNRYEHIPFFTHRLPGNGSTLPHQRYDAKDISNYRFSIGIGYYF